MKAETFLYVGSITLIIIVFGSLLFFELNKETIDYTDRFERLETGIKNSSVDVCFLHGGKWLSDGNNLVWQEIEPPVGYGFFGKKQVAFCVR